MDAFQVDHPVCRSAVAAASERKIAGLRKELCRSPWKLSWAILESLLKSCADELAAKNFTQHFLGEESSY